MAGDTRKMILRMLQEGKITLEEADQLLGATGQGQGAAPREKDNKAKNIFDRVVSEVESTIGTIRTGVETGRTIDSIGRKIGDVFNKGKEFIENGLESVSSSFQEGERFELIEQLSFPVPDTVRQLALTNLKGNVTVIGEDRNDMALSVTKVVYAAGEDEAEKKARALHIAPQTSGDRMRVDVPETTRAVFLREAVELECRVPKRLVPSVSTDTGSITVRGMAYGDGEADLKTVSGHVTLERIEGDLKAQTVSGEIKVRQAKGRWQLKTVSGALDAADSGFSGSIQSTSARVALQGDLDGHLAVQSLSGAFDGDVKVAGSGGLEVSTTSGDIVLHLRDGSDAQVTAATQSGAITCSAALEGKESAEHQLKGKIGGGAGQVSLRSTSGAITVK